MQRPGDRSRALAVAALAGLLLLAPVAASRAEPEREVLAGPPSEAMLVLPLNVVTAMPPELASMAPVVWDDLTGYLKDQRLKLKTARMSDAAMLWRASIRRVREESEAASAGFDDALSLLVEALGEHAEFSTVLVPSLLLREAHIRNRRAEWDGVSESVEFRASSPEAKKLALLLRFEGVAPGASLHVVALDAAGRKLHEKTHGLELIAAVRVVEDPDEPFVYETRKDIFQDPASVRASVALALDPFVPLPRSRPD